MRAQATTFRVVGAVAALMLSSWDGVRANDPPTIKVSKEIRLTDGEGLANISVGPDGLVPPGSWLGIMSLETPLSLSAGKPWSDRGWKVLVADLPGLRIKVKQDARGDTLLVIGLMSPEDDVLASAQAWLIVNGGASVAKGSHPEPDASPVSPSPRPLPAEGQASRPASSSPPGGEAAAPDASGKPATVTQPTPEMPDAAPKAPAEPPLPVRRPSSVKTDVAEAREPEPAYPAPFSQKPSSAPLPGAKQPPVAAPTPLPQPSVPSAVETKPVEPEATKPVGAAEAPAPAPPTRIEPSDPAKPQLTEKAEPAGPAVPQGVAAAEAPAPTPAVQPKPGASAKPKEAQEVKTPSAVVAPAVPPPSNTPAKDAPPEQDAAVAKGYVIKGQQQLALGNVVGARLFLKRAAEAGSAEAALILGDTYDAGSLARLGAIGVAASPAEARRWYEKARELGAAELAAARIERMQP